MRRANEHIKNKSQTETYVKLSDVHREFGEWCRLNKDYLDGMNEISKKYFHYFVNLLPSIEIEVESENQENT